MYEVPFGHRNFCFWKKTGERRFGGEIPCYSTNDVERCIVNYHNAWNCGISVCTFLNDTPYLLYVAFDFDDEQGLERPLREAIKTYNFFEIAGYDVMLNYSGSKGFHVLVQTKPEPYKKSQLRSCHEFIQRFFNLETLDHKLFGDVVRKIRIPGTRHIETGNLCRNLAYSEGKPLDVTDFFVEPENGTYELQIDENIDYRKGDTREYIRPCIAQLVEDRDTWMTMIPDEEDFQPDHLLRVSWVAMHLWKGFTPQEVLEKAEKIGWDDWNKRKTYNQIRQIYRKGNYVPYSCESMKSMGLCFVEDCPLKKADKMMNSIKKKNGDD